MLLNNANITTFKAKLLSKNVQTATIIIYDDWLGKALSPLYLGKQETFKELKLKFLIEDINDESCLINIGNIIRQFEKCTIKFDDLIFYYDCTIASKDHERLQKGYFALNVDLKGVAYTSIVNEVLDHISSKTITVLGNRQTSAILTVTAPVDTISVTVTGLGTDSIIIKNLKANIPVVVDGEVYTVISNGLNKFADTDMWAFPVLQPGTNTIGVSSPNNVINVSYKPKYF